MLGVARTEAVASAPQDSYLQVKAVSSTARGIHVVVQKNQSDFGASV